MSRHKYKNRAEVFGANMRYLLGVLRQSREALDRAGDLEPWLTQSVTAGEFTETEATRIRQFATLLHQLEYDPFKT